MIDPDDHFDEALANDHELFCDCPECYIDEDIFFDDEWMVFDD